MSFCLPKFASEEMKKSLKDGTINPETLIDMTSAERRSFFEKIVGKDNAPQVNALFEGKILLKNQQQGIIRWAKQLTGITPEVQRDILSRVNKMQEVLEPKELDAFLEDLAAKRLGFGVSVEEAKKIAELAKTVEEARGNEDRMVFGRAKVEFNKYVSELKLEAESETFREQLKTPGKLALRTAGMAKSLKATLDVSAIGRQGWRVMITDPKQWGDSTARTFKDLVTKFGEDAVIDEINADIVSRPNYDKMLKAKLAVGNTEEAFPEGLPEKIPYLGRAFKASESAFTAFSRKVRADVFDKYLSLAEKAGVDITDKEQLIGIGNLVNSLTGRSQFGRYEQAADLLNNLFFSPRFVKSHIDTLLLQPLGAGGVGGFGSFAQKQAAKNLAKIVAANALILAVAYALVPKGVELDPRSADFGKIKIGNTRFDISGGMSSVLTLAARILTLSTKSTATGVVKPLNSGDFGGQTGLDIMNSFLENKLSPAGAVFRDLLEGQDPNGEKPGVGSIAKNLFVPLPITNFLELKNDPNSAPILAALIADGLGIATNTYGNSASMAGKDKDAVLQEVYEKLAAGDKDGAKDLAHSFNEELKKAIHDDLLKQNTKDDLDEAVDKKWKSTAIVMPSDDDVQKFIANGNEVVEKTTKTGKPVVKEDTPLPTQGVIGTIVTYAHAIGTDPGTAFNDIFKGQKIRQVTNGTVIVYRMSLKESEAVKKKGGGNNTSMKLDHTLPLQLGGNNEENNLKLVSTEIWKSYTPVEDYLGRALKNKTADKKTAQSLILKFKKGEITFDQIKEQVKDK